MAGFYFLSLRRFWLALLVGVAVLVFAFFVFSQEPGAEPHEESAPQEESVPHDEGTPREADEPHGEAPPEAEFSYPVAELGNCGNKEECKAYCDDLNNKNACLRFARQHRLIDEDNIERAEKLPPAGPGGCGSESQCRAYCSDPAHGEECLAFAEEHDAIPREEITRLRGEFNKTGPGGCRGTVECSSYCSQPSNQAECLEFARREGHINEEQYRRAQSAFKGGPGGCQGPDECRAYCSEPSHVNECLDFAEREGFVPPEEARRIRKLGAVEGPGGCKFEECRAYCEDPAHQTECVEFAERNGLMSPEEARIAKKMAGKTGPGGCRGRECAVFCNNPDNAEVCIEFASAEGIMPPEEVARARKFMQITRDGGPGGCRGIECRDFCNNPQNREQCFSFAKNNGLIPQEEIARFEAGLKIHKVMETSGGPGGCRNENECRVYCSDPSHVEECVAFGATHGGMSEAEVRKLLKEFAEGRGGPDDFGPPPDVERFQQEAFRKFEEFRQLEQQFRGGPGGPGFGPAGFGSPDGFPGAPGQFPGAPGVFPGGPGGFVGPGGCTSPAECIQYCTTHKEECFGMDGGPGFGPGGPSGGFGGPRGAPQLRSDLIRPTPSVPTDAPSAPSFTPRSAGTLRVNVSKNSSSGFDIIIRASQSIDEFSLVPAAGKIRNTASYGGIVGCQPEFKIDRLGLLRENFPLTVRVKDCGGNELEQKVPATAAGLEEVQTPTPDVTSSIPVGPSADQMGLVPPEAASCLSEIYGENLMAKINRGEALPPADFQQSVTSCIQKQFEQFAPPGTFPSGESGPSSQSGSNGFFATIIEAFANLLKSK